jgi:O-antigen/teichoic acid export membrane protein
LITFSSTVTRFPSVGKFIARVQRSDIASRLLHGAFWSLLGTLLTRFLTLGSTMIIAHLLGKEDFGALGMLQSTLAMFQVFAGFGLGLTATKYVAEFRAKDPRRAGRIIALSTSVGVVTGLIVCGGAYMSASWLATHSLAAPRLAPLVRLGAFDLLLTAINGAQMGALAGFERFKKIAHINVFGGMTYVVFSLAGISAFGLYGAIGAVVLSDALLCLVSHVVVRTEARRLDVPVRLADCRQELPVLWKFSAPAVLSGLMVTPIYWLCNSLLVQQPGGYAQMAVYTASSSWRNVLMYLPTMLVQASLPVLSSAADAEGSNRFRSTINITQTIMVAIAFPAATLLMLAAVPILRLYGKGFTTGDSVLIGVVLTALIQCIGAAGGPAIEAKGRMWFALLINGSWAVIYLLFVYLSVERFGANSLAYGAATAYVFLTVWVYVYMRRDLPEGMLSRVLLAVGFALILGGICVVIPARLRLYAALPVTALSGFVAVAYLTDRKLWRSLVADAPKHSEQAPRVAAVNP